MCYTRVVVFCFLVFQPSQFNPSQLSLAFKLMAIRFTHFHFALMSVTGYTRMPNNSYVFVIAVDGHIMWNGKNALNAVS